jgi:hypothetical protein
VMLTLGLLSAAGAGVAAFMKKSAPKDDPWATPLEDPYVAPSTGRHSKLESVSTVDAADTPDAADTVDSVDAANLETGAIDDAGQEILESVDEDSVPDPLAPPDVDAPPNGKGKG